MILRTSSATFTATTTNQSNTLGAGTVVIEHNRGSALFTPTALLPGNSATVCVGVRYTGTLTPSAVRLYFSGAQESDHGGTYVTWANDATSEMDDNLSLQILINGTDLATDPGSSCTPAGVGSFTALTGAAPGTSLRTLIDTRRNYATGLSSSWSPVNANVWRVFKFIYTFSSSAPLSAQGDGLSVTVNWEAQR